MSLKLELHTAALIFVVGLYYYNNRLCKTYCIYFLKYIWQFYDF